METEKCPICNSKNNVSLNADTIPEQFTCRSCETTWDKKEEEIKSGMYGEMPKLSIGKFEISLMSNKQKEQNVWIQDLEADEGGEFKISSLETAIQNFFNSFF